MFQVLALLLAVTLGLAGDAEARMHHPYRGHRIIPATGTPPLDTFPPPAGAYSFRKLLSSYSGPSARIRRTSDNAEIDIGFLGFTGFTGAPWNEAAAAAHCAATTCAVVTRYDQSGNARHLTQAAAANQPVLVLNCQKGLSCARTTAATQTLVSAANFAPATGAVTLSAVANRALGTTACHAINQNAGNRLQHRAGTAGFSLFGGVSGPVNIAVADAAWHAVAGTVNGAASVIRAEAGVTATATAVGSTTAGVTTITGNNTSTCDHVEAIHWDTALSEAEVTLLLTNQQNFWLP